METSTESVTELTSSPSLRCGFHDEADKITDEFSSKMTINRSDDVVAKDKSDEDFSFSFASVSVNESPVSAEDVFQNGKIKPIFPYFDRSVEFSGESDNLPCRQPVKKVFIETEDSPAPPERLEGEADGPYCVWNRKAVEASPEVCKKSNSTGFSKIWRFREMVSRSNSDGRDAFVFLNSSTPTTSSKLPAPDKSKGTSEKKSTGEDKVAGLKGKAKKGKKVETASLSAHYARNRAIREEDRRRSYLPYKPEVLGFFTNVHGGLSRNLHPF